MKIFHPLKFCILIAGICASGVVIASEFEPGVWRFWKSDKPVASGKPSLEICITAEGAKDPVALVGDIPGDSSCTVASLQAGQPSTLNFDYTCGPGGLIAKGSTVKSDGRFVTALVQYGQTYSKSYIHGVRIGNCEK